MSPPLQVRAQTRGPDTVLEFVGKLDGSLPQATRDEVLSHAQPGCRLVLDLSARAPYRIDQARYTAGSR